MDANSIVNIATPVVVPLVIALIKKILPLIPTWVIPIIAPALGGVIGLIAQFSLQNAGNIWLSVALGLAGVGVREVIDQLKPVPKP